MRHILPHLLICAAIAGCAAQPAPSTLSTFALDVTSADGNRMADDAARKLSALYPPARTRFNLRQATPDAFGISLVDTLRTKGYALAEFKQDAPAATANDSFDLAYVVDQPFARGQLRITLLINNQPLSRIYETKDGALSPASYWIRKE